MTLTIKAHFEAGVIVPDEPLELASGQELQVQIETVPFPPPQVPSPEAIAERIKRLGEGAGSITDGPAIPTEALRREHLYESEPELDLTQRAEALKRFLSRAVHGVDLPADALRRENMYED